MGVWIEMGNEYHACSVLYVHIVTTHTAVWYIGFSKRVDGTRFNDGLVCDLKKDLDSISFLGWRL